MEHSRAKNQIFPLTSREHTDIFFYFQKNPTPLLRYAQRMGAEHKQRLQRGVNKMCTNGVYTRVLNCCLSSTTSELSRLSHASTWRLLCAMWERTPQRNKKAYDYAQDALFYSHIDFRLGNSVETDKVI